MDNNNNKEESLSTEEPHNNDVLCGRGGTINAHPGNEQYRMFVDRKKRVYLTARFKREKRLIAQSIVDEVRNLSPPGRFLLKDPKTNIWSDVGDEKARDKTSQALRENALTVRKQMEKEYQESYKKQIREEAIVNGLDPDVAVENMASSVLDINEYDGKANSVKPSEQAEKKKQQQQQVAKGKKGTAKLQQTTADTVNSATQQQLQQLQVQQQLQAQVQLQASLSQSPVAQADNQWLLQQQQVQAAQAQQNQAGYSYLPQQAGIDQQQMSTLQSIQQQQQAQQFQQQFLSAPQAVIQPQLSQSAPQSIQPTNEEYQQFLKWKESQQPQQSSELQKQALQAAQQAAQLQAAQAQSQQPQHTISHQSAMSAHAQWNANNQPVHIAAPPPTHINLRPSRPKVILFQQCPKMLNLIHIVTSKPTLFIKKVGWEEES